MFEYRGTDFSSWVKFKTVNKQLFFTLILPINDTERVC